MATPVERSMQRFAEKLATVDEVATSVLKGHLLIEEHLDEMLSARVHNEVYLEEMRLGFAQKVQLARAFALNGGDQDPIWQLIVQINSIRNDLAHRLRSPQRANKLASLRKLFLEVNSTNPQVEALRGLPDASLIILACALASGFLGARQSREERIRSASDVPSIAPGEGWPA